MRRSTYLFHAGHEAADRRAVAAPAAATHDLAEGLINSLSQTLNFKQG